MYKNTRHAGKMWTYAARTLRSHVAGTEDESKEILADSKRRVMELGLLRTDEFVLDNLPTGALFTFTRLINERIRMGCSYMRKLDFPDTLISTTPNYILIAPKLGAVLRRLGKKLIQDIPHDLRVLHDYLQTHGMPAQSSARPVFSANAQRIKGPGRSKGIAAATNENLKHTSPAAAKKSGRGNRVELKTAPVAPQQPIRATGEKTALAFAFEAVLKLKKA